MNASRNATAPASSSIPSRGAGFGRQMGEALTLFPAGLFALVMALGGQDAPARRALRAGAGTGRGRVMVHAFLTVLLGVLALIVTGVLAIGTARGLFYGFVDSGPYDDSWGGPTKAGAWLAHFAVSLPVTAVSVGLLYGLAALHRRMTAPLRGERRPAWVLPIVLLSCVGASLFVVAFSHQLH
ncbi:hypothetical protein [Streptomyces spirodelae]|uniref:DUF420 domain-containing protein n=1 Tax=Streptomyces spirodelae TaxID=2812904 RepID=A0ABS3WN25_9ACTN|nr:hypothetical protein [Streptomyces spirodelae]MBO8184419.1 hypothetical protein [Streptomyces spirodelae]